MAAPIKIVTPGPNHTLIGEYGENVTPPVNWEFLPAGDAAITRKITVRDNFWRVQVKKGRRTITKGIWAHKEIIREAKDVVHTVRMTDDYKKKREYALRSRERKQAKYEVEFLNIVENFLSFHPIYHNIQHIMAKLVTEHAVPIGSGTVARTERIPIKERASKAVIAWMRHQTTAYDSLQIAHIKGERRAIRKLYAAQSITLLKQYRKGLPISENCPLQKAVQASKLK